MQEQEVYCFISNKMEIRLAAPRRNGRHLSDERYPGSMGFDYEANWSLLIACIKDLLKETGVDPKQIKGISATSMREGIVLYNASGDEIWACANVDSRASEEVSYLKQTYEELEEKLYHLSGQTFALSAIPRIYG